MVYDLPAGGRRLIQKIDGYRYTIVDGVVTYEDGQPTGKCRVSLFAARKAMPMRSVSLLNKKSV